jgi:putative transposase
MKKSRYTKEQIIGILKQHEAGVKTADLCREHGISAATFHVESFHARLRDECLSAS